MAATRTHQNGAPRARIVVGVDGSDRSLDAVALAQRLAAPTGAVVLVAHVCPISFSLPAEHVATVPFRRDAERTLDRLRPALDSLGPWERRIVDESSPARGLHELAVRERADLLVLGSTHRGPVGRVLLGTVARRLLHGAPCPVAVAPHAHEPRPSGRERVVGAAFDGSRDSREALEAAARWACHLGARLHIVSALELPSPANPVFGTMSYRDTVEAMRRSARARLAAARTAVDVRAGVTTELAEGDPLSVLANASEALDLLVVGSRGYGPVRSVLLGGVTAPLLERATCPVLVQPRSGAHAGGDATPRDHSLRRVGAA